MSAEVERFGLVLDVVQLRLLGPRPDAELFLEVTCDPSFADEVLVETVQSRGEAGGNESSAKPRD